jgi:hypothetical protein
LTVIAGGKSQSNLKTAKEIKLKEEKHVDEGGEDFLRDVLAPSLYDLHKEVAELREMHEKLLRLLARVIKTDKGK